MLSKIVKYMILATVIHSHTFILIKREKLDKILKNHVLINTRKLSNNIVLTYEQRKGSNQSELIEDSIKNSSRLPNVENFIKIFNTFAFVWELLIALKYGIICLLDLEILSEYRYLTCFIIGRVVLNGRVLGLTNYIVLLLAVFHLVWRSMMLIYQPRLKLYCIEFMLYNYQDVLIREVKTRAKTRTIRLKKYSQDSLADNYIDSGQSNIHNFIFEYKNQFSNYYDNNSAFLLRPNRTTQAWLYLARLTIIYFTTTLIILILAFPYLLMMQIPVLLTKQGFELSYSTCVNWILRQQDTSNYSYIYVQTPANISTGPIAFLPLVNIVDCNLYHIFRLVWEVIENLICYVDTMNSFVFHTFVSVIIAIDIRYYALAINKEMEILVRRISYESNSISHELQTFNSLDSDINDLQSMLLDYFSMVNSYNTFASFYILFCSIMWLTYSAVVCSWLFIAGNLTETYRLEWYIIQLIMYIYTVIIWGSYASIKLPCRRTYSLIATLMARDSNCEQRKQRWLLLAKHYYPKSLYCFTLFGATEMSWLSLLKLIVWLFSALLVTSSFLTVYRI